MQNTTGCKINVSPPAGGADIQRDIGLVGSYNAIESAKRAIWDKVGSVVSDGNAELSAVLRLISSSVRSKEDAEAHRNPCRMVTPMHNMHNMRHPTDNLLRHPCRSTPCLQP